MAFRMAIRMATPNGNPDSNPEGNTVAIRMAISYLAGDEQQHRARVGGDPEELAQFGIFLRLALTRTLRAVDTALEVAGRRRRGHLRARR